MSAQDRKNICGCGLAIHNIHGTLRSISREAYKSLPEVQVHNELVRLCATAETQIAEAEQACKIDLDLAKRAIAVARQGVTAKDRKTIYAEVESARKALKRQLEKCISPEKLVFV